jgi:hypothetical protein
MAKKCLMALPAIWMLIKLLRLYAVGGVAVGADNMKWVGHALNLPLNCTNTQFWLRT